MIPDLPAYRGYGESTPTRYIQCVRDLVRQNLRFFFFAFLSAVAMRLLFLIGFPRVTDDSLVYGEIANNWLTYGIYGLTHFNLIAPTCMRLPGYPGFLAAVFAVFGKDNYAAVWVIQILFDLVACVVIADIARRIFSDRAAKAALLLAAFCPFLANYAAAALTETLEIFCTAVAFDFAIIGVNNLPNGRMRAWIGCGLATGGAILLRPDGGLLLMAIGLYLAWLFLHPVQARLSFTRAQVFRAAVVFTLAAVSPLVPWTIRNYRTLHTFQPLAPRYSNDPGEFVDLGFNRWVKTWMADYVSVEEIYWQVSGQAADIDKLPDRAFDSSQQRLETAALLADYNLTHHLTPALDQRFANLAAERIHAAPLRYYVWLPLLRIADMWFRPRTELLPADSRWWEFDDEISGSVLAVLLGIIGLAYPALALAGTRREKLTAGSGLLVVFVILRSTFLGSLENPEPRYILECYPVVISFAGALLANIFQKA